MAEGNQEGITELIKNERPQEPLTDEQISQKLSILRETVTNIRKKLNIPSSRDRKRMNVKKAVDLITTNNLDLTIASLVAKLKLQGFKVTRGYIGEIINSECDERTTKELQSRAEEKMQIDSFQNLTGYDGSLTNNIKQGKASVLYPPFGLPTLIIGESGTGKTLFAECIYQYAVQKKIIEVDGPFVSLNCADYSDNPQLLLSMLYGYKKGAFTGANQDTEGLVERANKGILFLDEIHRLPPKGQEMLFSILDKGKFRRLGEVVSDRKAQIYFIGATTENIESSLLLTFRRRIPMIIELPSLKERSIKEKIQLIYSFFQEESNRTHLKIFVKAKIMEAFVQKKYLGNIGQLKSEIQVTCANAYVEKMNNSRDEINIGFNEMLYHNFFSNNTENSEMQVTKLTVTFKDMLFIPNTTNKGEHLVTANNSHYSLPKDIYEKIEEKYYELKKANVTSAEIEKIIWNFILSNFSMMGIDSNNDKNVTSLEELKYLVGENIAVVVKEFIQRIKKDHSQLQVNEKVAIYLAIHISEAMKRINFKQDIINPNLIYIKENLKSEYDMACSLVYDLEAINKVRIPEGEVGFIAMYINELLKPRSSKSRINIIVISHGKIASEMIAVANKMMNVDFPIAVDMPFNVNPIKIFEQIIEISKTLDSQSGILFFVDMGSLLNVGEIVEKRTGIKTRTIDRVDLVSVMEAIRKVYISEETLDDIYYDIMNSKHTYHMVSTNHSDKPLALIAMCLTGHGVAIKIKELLAVNYPHIKVISLSILEANVKQEIHNLKQQYTIPAIIGTMNPYIEGINFIPFENNFTQDKKMLLDQVLKQKNYNSLKKSFREDFIMIDLACETKQEVIETMSMVLFNNGFIKKGYIDSVFERENMSSTCFKKNVAIPHGLPSFVNETSIISARLSQAIEWDDSKNLVNLVFLLAVKDDDINIINDLFKLLKQKNNIDEFLKAKNRFEFIKVLYNSFS
ncbi:sigma 54-interacting transcriptional regulator [Pelosinus propionicus]|uniref:Transcriptional regulator containing an AAA-type ATPase domain and a DNA-binding domain n=1 Tax=Pelosinus propionicus DSM 13327 TaxID=1123291 RepID=A0A1I4IA83_9FIRM|nr:sigma 54-interacting transcriptional regulator [Pelosinus propionicus]SFL50963.1 Transcriptional regulator containing an AAA-type ATPase domain and a DNA-binding domain [Pelosinus propionicus DSM 13327]